MEALRIALSVHRGVYGTGRTKTAPPSPFSRTLNLFKIKITGEGVSRN